MCAHTVFTLPPHSVLKCQNAQTHLHILSHAHSVHRKLQCQWRDFNPQTVEMNEVELRNHSRLEMTGITDLAKPKTLATASNTQTRAHTQTHAHTHTHTHTVSISFSEVCRVCPLGAVELVVLSERAQSIWYDLFRAEMNCNGIMSAMNCRWQWWRHWLWLWE